MPATYEPIATTTLGSAGSITFSSIGTGYTDLRVVLAAASGSGSVAQVTFNADGGSNYSRTILTGNGTAASSARTTSASLIALNSVNINNSYPSLFTIDIFNYAGSTNKTCLYECNLDFNGSGAVQRGVALWRSTSAINSIELMNSGGVYGTGTTATLYGILKA